MRSFSGTSLAFSSVWRSVSMNKLYISLSLCLVLGMPATGFAQTAAKDIHDEIEQTTKAATIFRDIMGAPDRAIPRRVLDDADCIAVFPQVIKAAFGIGGRGGRGVGVCRNAGGGSAPAILKVGGASVGLQIGAQAPD